MGITGVLLQVVWSYYAFIILLAFLFRYVSFYRQKIGRYVATGFILGITPFVLLYYIEMFAGSLLTIRELVVYGLFYGVGGIIYSMIYFYSFIKI